MNKIPPLGPSDSNDDDYDYDNYDNDVAWQEWQTALDWARKGDFKPLAECLRRADLPLNNDDVRNWLADGLLSPRGFKKPNKVALRPVLVPFEMDGRHFHINERHLKKFKAMKLVGQLEPTLGKDAAIKAAGKEFNIKPKTLREDLDRPRSFWGLHPKKTDGMFDVIPRKPGED